MGSSISADVKTVTNRPGSAPGTGRRSSAFTTHAIAGPFTLYSETYPPNGIQNDLDGFADKADLCPNEVGPESERGCPKVYKDVEVTALVTPTEKSLAGDYMTTLRASSRGETASTQFRVTVTTSTLWGIVGVGIIGIALLIMVGAVARFGRR